MDDQPLIVHTFKGQRFDDHGLDLDVLPEFAVYNKIVMETAKELWRRNNPDKLRMRKNIEDEYRLKIYNIQAGSVSVPIHREIPSGCLFALPGELEVAVDLIQSAIESVAAHLRLPDGFPKSVIPLFCNYGKTLKADEYIEHRIPRTGKVAAFTQDVRAEFEKRQSDAYVDEFDIVGSVIMARVNKPKISVLLDDGSEVEAPFDDSDKNLVLLALDKYEQQKIRLVGKAQYSSEGVLQKILQITEMQLYGEPCISAPPSASAVPVWERCLKVAEKIPPEAQALLPSDAASNLDKYLFPKEV